MNPYYCFLGIKAIKNAPNMDQSKRGMIIVLPDNLAVSNLARFEATDEVNINKVVLDEQLNQMRKKLKTC